jgi:ribosomal protein S18 acetylase RimI-like enzyme
MTTKPVTYLVRAATPADTEKILALWQEAADMLANADKRYRFAPDAVTRRQSLLREWLERPDVAVFVAESMIKEGHLLGYIVGSVVENLPTLLPEKHGYVSDLAVDAHGKAGGIGRNLFEALKGWFRDRGVTHVEARVPHRHAVAQAFWRALGATEWYEHLWLKLE